MSNSELRDLVEKYLGDRMSPEERRRLQELGQSEANREELAAIIGSVLQQDRYQERSELGRDQAFDYILTQAEERRSASAPIGLRQTSILRPKIGRRRFSAAAAFLIVVSGITFFGVKYLRKPASAPAQPVMTTVPILPGGDRAILTLSDGATITLDSARNGSLSTQGNTRIIKLTDGRLAYQVNTDPTVRPGAEEPVRYNTITTPRGGEYQVLLPDSSIVWLNSASSLKFPVSFAKDQRLVILTGEAYFEISKKAKAPFTVEVEGLRIDVLGTNFDIMAYRDEESIRTTLVEGAVKLTRGNASVRLNPDQEAAIAPDGAQFTVQPADIEQALAWKEGRFRFRRTDIRTIMRQIARWYDVSVEYKGDLSGIRLYGTMSRKENAAQIFELLEQTGKVHFSTAGDHITVAPPATGK